MGVWWIVGAAVLALVVVIGLAAWWYLLGEREDWDDETVLVLQDDYVPGVDVDAAALDWSDVGSGLRPLPPGMDSTGEPALDAEPVDGDAYAAELRSIGQAAAADPWHYDSLALITRMPVHWQAHGYTPDDWLRCNLPHADYMALLEHKNWLRDLARADRERETRRRELVAA